MASTFKVTLTCSAQEGEAIAALLTEVLDPPPAVSISGRDVLRAVEVYFVDRPDLDALAALVGDCVADSLVLHEIREENWVALVQRGLHPVAGGRFLIHGSHDRAAGAGRRYAIEIDAGRAFGTAHHGTTRGCLIAIDRLAKRLRWQRILDLGTGSGVLAIAAAKASNARILASDIDPVAIGVARENIRRNGALGAVRAAAAPSVDQVTIRSSAPFDLIVSNILAGPLIALAPRVVKLLAPSGHIVLSGLLDGQAREVSAIYLQLGLVLEQRLSLEGWTTLTLRRPW